MRKQVTFLGDHKIEPIVHQSVKSLKRVREFAKNEISSIKINNAIKERYFSKENIQFDDNLNSVKESLATIFNKMLEKNSSLNLNESTANQIFIDITESTSNPTDKYALCNKIEKLKLLFIKSVAINWDISEAIVDLNTSVRKIALINDGRPFQKKTEGSQPDLSFLLNKLAKSINMKHTLEKEVI